MKRARTLITLLCVALAGAPLFAQDALESEMEQIAEDARAQAAAAQSPGVATTPAAEPKQPTKVMPMSEKPKRFFEIGADIDTGIANNALVVNELFREELILDIPKIRKKVGANGMNMALSPSSMNTFLNINIGDFFGVGVFSKVEGELTFTLGSALLDFLADGNINSHDLAGDAVSVAGGIFMEAGLNAFLHLDRWTFTASPATFMPLIYIPKSTLAYYLNTSGETFNFRVNGEIKVYTPFPMDDGMDIISSINGDMGFDLTVGAEYGLFDWLYVGGTANHIPIIPSRLYNLMSIRGDDLGIEVKDPLSNPTIETTTEVKQEYSDNENKTVIRPLTFDVYAKWKLLDMSLLKFTLKPNLGITVITASDEPTFNWGIQADLNLLSFLSFHLGTGLNQGVWKHRAGIGINLRILEILAEASIQSTDFNSSFNTSGAGIGIGFRFGF